MLLSELLNLKLYLNLLSCRSGYPKNLSAIHEDITHIRIGKFFYGSKCESRYQNLNPNPDPDLDFAIPYHQQNQVLCCLPCLVLKARSTLPRLELRLARTGENTTLVKN